MNIEERSPSSSDDQPQPDKKSLVKSPQIKSNLNIFLAALPVLLHVSVVATTAIFIFVYVSDHIFGTVRQNRATGSNIEDERSQAWVPLQSDVITTLSFLLIILRFFHTAWCVDVAWKCMFILLERTGLSLSQIKGLIKHKLLLRSGIPTGNLSSSSHLKRPDSTSMALKLLVLLILVLPLPAQLSSPLLTGSITWEPVTDYLKAEGNVFLANFSAGNGWDVFNESPSAREIVVNNAVKYYNLFYPSYNDTSMARLMAKIPSRYRMPTYPKMDPAPMVPDVYMPYIDLSFAGQADQHLPIKQVPLDKLEALNPQTSRLNITPMSRAPDFLSPLNEMDGWTSHAILIPDEPWKQAKFVGNQSSPRFELPSPDLVSGQFYVAVRVSSATGSSPDTSGFVYSVFPDRRYWMYRVNVTAGLALGSSCTIKFDRAISCLRRASNQMLEHIRPDVLAKQVIWLMPQVIDSILRTAPFLPDYTQLSDGSFEASTMLIQRAYSASWNALVGFTSDDSEDHAEAYDVYQVVTSTKAVVHRSRAYVWIGLQALVWVAAIIFVIIQRHCKRPLTIDTAIALFFLERDEELQTYAQESGLTELVKVCPKKHNKELGLLRLDYDLQKRRSRLIKWGPGRKRTETDII